MITADRQRVRETLTRIHYQLLLAAERPGVDRVKAHSNRLVARLIKQHLIDRIDSDDLLG